MTTELELEELLYVLDLAAQAACRFYNCPCGTSYRSARPVFCGACGGSMEDIVASDTFTGEWLQMELFG